MALKDLTRLTIPEIIERYGQPGDVRNFTTIALPYPMKISWLPNESIKKAVCHKLVAAQWLRAFNDILTAYGAVQIEALMINIYGGCFNHRPKRGLEKKYIAAIAAKNFKLAATYLSTHSWAIPFDLLPDLNLLRENHHTARFARPEYKKMIECFYDNNILGYGPENDFDWMHFEPSK